MTKGVADGPGVPVAGALQDAPAGGASPSKNDDARPLTDVSDGRIWGMVESAPDGMLLTDEHGVILVVNRQIEAMFGYDRGELLGRTVEDLIPDRHRAIHTAHRTRYRVDPTPRMMGSGLELWARRRDGQEFPVEISLSPVTGLDGLAVVASVRDVSERLATEAKVHLIQAAIDAAHDGVFMFSPETLRFEYVNQGAVNQTGYGRDELLTMTPLHVEPEFTRDSLRELIAPLVSDDVSQLTFRTVHRTRSGHDVPVDVLLNYPPAGHPTATRLVVALVRDITRQLEAEAQLRASETGFRTAFEEAPVGMLLTRLDGGAGPVIERVNAAFCALLGRGRDELVGTSLDALTHPEDRLPDPGNLAHYSGEQRYRRADGSHVWVLLSSTALGQGAGAPVLAHVVDISDRRAAEDGRDRQERWLQAVTEVRRHLLEERPIAEVLETVCRFSIELGDADMAVIGMPEPSGSELEVRAVHAADGRAAPELRVNTAMRSVIETLGPVVLEGAGTNGRGIAGVDDAVGPVLMLPMPDDDDRCAVLVLSRDPDRAPFAPHEVVFLEAFVQQVNAALTLARSRQDRERIVLYEDRVRIGQDLHDVVIQRLFAAGMGLQSVLGYVSPPNAAAKIDAAVAQLDVAIAELRSAIFGLSAVGTRASVAEQIRGGVAVHAERLGFPPTCTLRGDPEIVPLVVVEQLLPTLNEALSNVARHAAATAVTVTVEATADTVTLIVSDDGVGLDPDRIDGRGLGNLGRRARRLGGTCHLTDNDERGARLIWRVPF